MHRYIEIEKECAVKCKLLCLGGKITHCFPFTLYFFSSEHIILNKYFLEELLL
jgi:hypothetical protein